jgi:hypothetical protein
MVLHRPVELASVSGNFDFELAANPTFQAR